MRPREKLTLEEKVALALELIKRGRTLDEIRAHYRVSHTTAYKVRNTFLEGGRAALAGNRQDRRSHDLEQRVEALEEMLKMRLAASPRAPRPARGARAAGSNTRESARKR